MVGIRPEKRIDYLTHIFMRRTIFGCLFALFSAAMASTSCIYDAPRGDDFYRTLWKSDEVPLEQFDVNSLTLEFLCNDGVSIRLNKGITIFGTYQYDRSKATFTNLAAYFEDDGGVMGVATRADAGDGLGVATRADAGDGLGVATGVATDDGVSVATRSGGQEGLVTFIEAYRDGDLLTLVLQTQDSSDPSTITMKRLSDYED